MIRFKPKVDRLLIDDPLADGQKPSLLEQDAYLAGIMAKVPPGPAVIIMSRLSEDDAAPRKRGRPVAPKPWEAAGVSRMTWYRRKKKDETK